MEKIEQIRHSLSHIMASAIQELYPGTKFGIGPIIEDGFYYDFDISNDKRKTKSEKQLTLEDLPKIENKMKELIKQNIKFERKLICKKEAQKLFTEQPYKLELIEEIEEKELSIYTSDNFIDLCRGPHIKSSTEIPLEGFKLTKIAGAYWKGDEKNPMLTRIYGVAFENKKELDDYLKKVEQAEKNDHRKLNSLLEFYQISDEVGPGLVIWKPKGAIIRNLIENFWKQEHQKQGYSYIFSPHIGKIDLWKKSGHTQFYKDNMYSPMEIDNIQYQIKPMNCPFHVQIFQSQIRSYKDLPLRLCELGTVYRYEKAGVLHGLLRVRGFTQDDAHIFCRSDQLEQEILRVVNSALFILNTFGFTQFEIDLSLRDLKNKSKYLGKDDVWTKAEGALIYALEQKGLKYQQAFGEAVFYGPKIDIKIKDSLGRPWQCTTIQVDFNFPQKFDLNYINDKGEKIQPIMIHHAILGAMERFMGCLIEYYEGALPLWLSPEQIWIIPIGITHKEYAQETFNKLLKENFRCQLKDENETVSKKIREGEIQKIPYLVIIGDKEINEETISIRQRDSGDLGPIKLNNFIKKIKQEIEERTK